MNLPVRLLCLSVIAGLFLSVPFSVPLQAGDGNVPRLAKDAEVAAEPVTVRTTRFLVLGQDRAAGLTDSMFVVTLQEPEFRATILQIPRDTYAEYTDRDYKKLNGAFRALGQGELKRVLGEALGVRLDYFVLLDLDALCRVVDSIGGVDVNIPQDMNYTDPSQGLTIDLSAGLTHLDGKQAEEFVRFRSGYADADLGRLDAQKLFLKAFAKKCQNLNAAQLFRLTASVLTDLQTDIGLPQAIRTVSALRKCSTDDLPMATLAGTAVQGTSGAWYYVVNRAKGAEMATDYLLPPRPLAVGEFDPKGFFDREEVPEFHHAYLAP